MEKKYNDNIKRNVFAYFLSGIFLPILFLAYFFTQLALSFDTADFPGEAMLFGMWVYLFEAFMAWVFGFWTLAIGVTGIILLSLCIKKTVLRRQIPNIMLLSLNSTLLIGFITLFMYTFKK